MKKEALDGLTSDQIRAKYQLPNKPTKISDVNVPAGTKMHRGKVNEILSEQNIKGQGAVQYNLKELIPESSFSNTKNLE